MFSFRAVEEIGAILPDQSCRRLSVEKKFKILKDISCISCLARCALKKYLKTPKNTDGAGAVPRHCQQEPFDDLEYDTSVSTQNPL